MVAPEQPESAMSNRAEFVSLAVVALLTAALVGVVAWLLVRAPASGVPADSALPALNASLNGATTLCLVFGWLAIRMRRVRWHRGWMLTAAGLSACFLVSYVVHHYQVGSVRFVGPAWLRALYLAVLVPHVVLSAAMVPLVLTTLWRALSADFARHRRVARWTLPLWLVVSVTGVLVYWMLYHLSPSFR
jgi:putative membrane protein